MVRIQVVPEGNKPEWSGGQRGLHLYLQRLLQPTWDEKLASAASKANPNCLMPNLSQDMLQVGRAAGFEVQHTCDHLLLFVTVVSSDAAVFVLHAGWLSPGMFLYF